MVRKIVLSIIAVLAVSFVALAQNAQVTGTVVDQSGVAVVGATVMVDGTTTGTTTDVNGDFSINAPRNGKLVISFIGYVDQTIEIAGKTNIKVTLVEDALAIESVQVIGYGSGNKVGAITGSISRVDGDLLKDKPTVNVADALQGKVAGLQVYTSSGEPSSSSSIRLHGVGSLQAVRYHTVRSK